MARPLIVIPAYNEESVIGDTVSEMLTVGDVLVVSDGTDRTAEVAREHGADVIRLEKRVGKGEAIRTGLSLSSSRISAYVDADMPVSAAAMARLADEVKAGHDIAIASRWKGKAFGYPFYRMIGSRIYNLSARLAGSRFADLQCGAKAMNRKGVNVALSTVSSGFFFDTEFLLIAAKQGLSVREVAVEWFHGRRRPKPRVADARFMMFDLLMFGLGKGKFRMAREKQGERPQSIHR